MEKVCNHSAVYKEMSVKTRKQKKQHIFILCSTIVPIRIKKMINFNGYINENNLK